MRLSLAGGVHPRQARRPPTRSSRNLGTKCPKAAALPDARHTDRKTRCGAVQACFSRGGSVESGFVQCLLPECGQTALWSGGRAGTKCGHDGACLLYTSICIFKRNAISKSLNFIMCFTIFTKKHSIVKIYFLHIDIPCLLFDFWY